MKIDNKKYGIFYKSQGRWTGPYAGFVASKRAIKNELHSVKATLKSKVTVRRVKFV